MKPRLSEADFIKLFEQHGAQYVADTLKINVTNVYGRRRRIENRLNRPINPPNQNYQNQFHPSREEHPARADATIKDGVVLVGSDAHYFPGIVSTAHRAFVYFCRKYRPRLIILNGDVIDASTISRFPPIGWEQRPTLISEIEAAKDRMNEIEAATKGFGCDFWWPIGNHDARFATRLATIAPEYAKVYGTKLKDHFGKKWRPCWSGWINNDVVVKHRFKGGIHATHNNTLWAGKTIVTGHLHSLKVTPFDDYNGTRWGIDTGTLAEPNGPQFINYTEDNPKNHRSGFIFMTFKDSKLLWPEVVRVVDEKKGIVDFRGELVKV